MADCDNDAHLQRFAADLRAAPVPLEDDARVRVLAAVQAERGTRLSALGTEPVLSVAKGHSAVPRRSRPLDWLFQRRLLSLSPLAGAALAASLVGLGVVGARLVERRPVTQVAESTRPPSAGSRPSTECTRPPSAGTGPSAECRVPTQFVLVAPRASSVAVVGDFNDWRELPMRAAGAGGVWTVTVPLAPGRHTYSFVVDGTTWIADPGAPFAPEDGFGSRNSVVMVSEASS